MIVIACTLRSWLSTSISYTPQYVASATVSVTTPGGSYGNIESAQEMAAVFPYVLTSGVLEDVVMNDMGLDYLPGTIDVQAEDGMNMLTISVSSDDPQMAYDMLTSVINKYPEVAEYIFGETKLQILDETGIPSDTRKEVVIRGSYKRGALQGIILSGLILCLYAFLKRTVHSKEQINKKINLHDLGSLPYVKMKKRGKSVILADCDPRNPSVAAVMNDTEKHPGISAVLRGDVTLKQAMTHADIPDTRLRILYGGEPDEDGASLLGSGKMQKIVEAMREAADYVILDSAPSELLADASLLAKFVDSVLYVVRCDYTKMAKIKTGIETFMMRDVKIMGYVFNADTAQQSGRYGYGYGYGYGRYSRYGGYGHYSGYSRYSRKLRGAGKAADKDGRILK